MNIPYVFKKCNGCGEWLVASTVNFYKNKSGKYGLESKCKKCRAEQRKQYYENNKNKILEQCKHYREKNKDKRKQYYKENKDKISERDKQYYEKNKDKILERDKQYREKNKDKILEQRKQYYQENRERLLEYSKEYRKTPQGQIVKFNSHHKRKVQKKNQGNGITKEQWLECMKYFEFRCAYSGEVLNKNTRSIDHIEPLNQGGEHEIWNLVPMDKGLNSSKNDKEMIKWYKEQDFFSKERLQKIYEWQEYAFNKWGYETLEDNELE